MFIRKLFHRLFPCRFSNPTCIDNLYGCKCGTWAMIAAAAITTGGNIYMSSQADGGGGGGGGLTGLPGFEAPKTGTLPSAAPVRQPNYLSLPAPTGGVAQGALNLPGFDKGIGGYETSPYYTGAQEQLSDLGGQLLSGDIPDYYKSIGEIGGPAFEDMLKGVRTDIESGVTSQAARLGQRGGAPIETIGREIAKVSPALRYQDMLRGIQGRESLLGLGAQITTGVRGSGLQEAGQRQTFDLNLAQMGLNQRQFEDKMLLNREQFANTINEEKRQFTENLQLQRDRDEITQAQFDSSLQFKYKQLETQAALYQQKLAVDASKAKGSMWENIIGGVGDIAGMFGGDEGGGGLGSAEDLSGGTSIFAPKSTSSVTSTGLQPVGGGGGASNWYAAA